MEIICTYILKLPVNEYNLYQLYRLFLCNKFILSINVIGRTAVVVLCRKLSIHVYSIRRPKIKV